jgi:para-nitrobenzyl esterase
MSEPLLSVSGGELRGRRLDGLDVDAFLGVPYARARRWADPVDPEPWTGVREAFAPGPVCPQPALPFSEWAHGPLPATDEDSLSVNVWRPRAAGPARPVLVFLHGGGWAIGWGSNPMLDGRHLARALDAVIVTLNYRLGSLGWLMHPALAAGPDAPAGNWGLADQVAALRWVAAHAPAFGGDPARITVAGESAGAGSVLHLLGRADATGLVHRAIAQSPPLHQLTVAPALGERWTAALVAQLGLGDDVAAALPALRALPAPAILAAQVDLLAGEFRGTRGGAMPILEPASLPADPAQAPASRIDVPLLVGTNADEGTFFFRAGGRRLDPEPAQLEAMVAGIAHTDDAPTVIQTARAALAARGKSGEPSANDVLCAVVTEAWFAGPTRDYAAARAAAGGEVHRYRIEYPAAEDDLGAVHTISVPLLFGSWREGGVARRLVGDSRATAAVTEAMTGDWRRFIAGESLDWDAVPAADGEPVAEVVYGGPDGARSRRRCNGVITSGSLTGRASGGMTGDVSEAAG